MNILKKPEKIVSELYRVLKKNGVSFNTVPALNLSWLMRMQSTIPNMKMLRSISEFIHLRLLRGSFLDKYHGYELSFTKRSLLEIHKHAGFKSVQTGAFAFHPSKNKVKSEFLKNLYFTLSHFPPITPIYFISAHK